MVAYPARTPHLTFIWSTRPSTSIMAAYPARTPPSGVHGLQQALWPPTLREHPHLTQPSGVHGLQQASWLPILREHPHLTPPSKVHGLQQNPMVACSVKGTLLEKRPPSTNLMIEYRAPPTLGGPPGNFSP